MSDTDNATPTGEVSKDCGHSPMLTYPAKDGWKCSVCDKTVSEYDD